MCQQHFYIFVSIVTVAEWSWLSTHFSNVIWYAHGHSSSVQEYRGGEHRLFTALCFYPHSTDSPEPQVTYPPLIPPLCQAVHVW